jgi:hypothetical protein
VPAYLSNLKKDGSKDYAKQHDCSGNHYAILLVALLAYLHNTALSHNKAQLELYSS